MVQSAMYVSLGSRRRRYDGSDVHEVVVLNNIPRDETSQQIPSLESTAQPEASTRTSTRRVVASVTQSAREAARRALGRPGQQG